jgi:3,4-dihydroxy 2-butanone 4-phosphate synthase/GTP cyclohydrolase II
VLARPGHTEAAVDLSTLAGCSPAGVLCEVVSADGGGMARTPELQAFAARHGLKCITIADLVRYRLRHDRLVERTASAALPTRYGTFQAHAYRSLLDGTEHVALVAGEVGAGEGVLARVHSEGMLGDIFGSERCNSGPQLDGALRRIAAAGRGALVYLRGQQGRGLGLAQELAAYGDAGACGSRAALEDASFPVDLRDYGVAAHVLRDLGVRSVRLLTNNATKTACLRAHGIQVLEQLPLEGPPGGGEEVVTEAAHLSRGVPRSRGAEAEHFA